MDIVFTDLDGTLLDHDTYSWSAAAPSLGRLAALGVPVVLVSSKTRAEMEQLRAEMGHRDPFIVENGGAAYLPLPSGGYERLEFGTPYPVLVEGLREAARRSGARVRGFSDMTVQEVAASTGLPPEKASLAAQREYDEPFLILGQERLGALIAELERLGLQCTRGGRFFHVCGHNDKALAVRAVTDHYRRSGAALRRIGLGDSFNDLSFLAEMDVAGIVNSAHAARLKEALPAAILSHARGPEGWAEIISQVIP
mgnify:CR=1 FL=1